MNQIQRIIMEQRIKRAYENGFLHGLIVCSIAVIVLLSIL